jgi:hypothetical protein
MRSGATLEDFATSAAATALMQLFWPLRDGLKAPTTGSCIPLKEWPAFSPRPSERERPQEEPRDALLAAAVVAIRSCFLWFWF